MSASQLNAALIQMDVAFFPPKMRERHPDFSEDLMNLNWGSERLHHVRTDEANSSIRGNFLNS
jgi:hypothetical protein